MQQIHVWAGRWLHEGDWLDEVARLKSDGKIGAFGISVIDHQPETAVEAVRSGLIDTIQVIDNVFDASPADELLPACAEHGVGVIVRVALDEGGLTGTIVPGMTFEPEDWRAHYFRGDRPAEVAEHTRAITEELGITTAELPETALRYVLSNPALSSVIVGMRSPQRVESNATIADGQGLPADRVEILQRHRWICDYSS